MPTSTLPKMSSSHCPSLSCFPEELILRILSLCVSSPAVHPIPAPHSLVHAWDYATRGSIFTKVPPDSGSLAHTGLTLLCVSKQFHRIVLPLFYRTLHLRTAKQLSGVLEALKVRPVLANAVRTVIFSAIWKDCDVLFTLCKGIDNVDICLDPGRSRSSGVSDVEAEAFCGALAQRDIFRLTIRKDPVTYLTHDRPQCVLEGLAQAIRGWTNLESVHLALRLSSSPTTLRFAAALSVAPRLRLVRSQVPAVWNHLLLFVSCNSSLQKITLYDYPGYAIPKKGPLANFAMASCPDDAIFGTGMYITEARKHARLFELIKAGTSFIRIRAHTTIAAMSNDTGVGTRLAPSKVKELAAGLLEGHQIGFELSAEPHST